MQLREQLMVGMPTNEDEAGLGDYTECMQHPAIAPIARLSEFFWQITLSSNLFKIKTLVVVSQETVFRASLVDSSQQRVCETKIWGVVSCCCCVIFHTYFACDRF